MIEGLNLRLKHLRIDKKMTQKEVADEIGITEAAMSSYESNTGTTPPGEIILRIARFYNRSIDFLYGKEIKQYIVSDGLTNDQLKVIDMLVTQFHKDNDLKLISDGQKKHDENEIDQT